MVKLQLLIAPHVTGYLHVQTNPKLSYFQAGTVNNAKSMLESTRNAAKKIEANINTKELLPYFKHWPLILISSVSA